MPQISRFFLSCLLADSRSAVSYDEMRLDRADRLRLQKNPGLGRRTDWQVSRFLKQQLASDCPIRSLSHSCGTAALLCGNVAAGVDIEKIKPRDFAALANWIACPEETACLAAGGWGAEAFYELWTLKEALLKAANLQFPDDMQKVGWLTDGQRVHGLHACGQPGWRGLTAVVDGGFMLACVWQGEVDWTWRSWLDEGAIGEIKKWP